MIEIWFEKPPVHCSDRGTLRVEPVDIFHSRVGQELILSMAAMGLGEADMKIQQLHKCPVCDGQGTVSRPPWVAGDQYEWSSTGTGPYPCRACGGGGIIRGEIDTAEVFIAGS